LRAAVVALAVEERELPRLLLEALVMERVNIILRRGAHSFVGKCDVNFGHVVGNFGLETLERNLKALWGDDEGQEFLQAQQALVQAQQALVQAQQALVQAQQAHVVDQDLVQLQLTFLEQSFFWKKIPPFNS
jgi:hypothetical protein